MRRSSNPRQLGSCADSHILGRVATDRERARSRARLEQLAGSGLDVAAIRHEAVRELQHVIGFDRWCWPLADPETLIPLGALAEHDYGPAVPRVLELEYAGEDFATMGTLGRGSVPAGSVSTETHGDLARSRRWDEVFRRVGIGDEAAVACRDAFGCWGWVKAYRDSTDRTFTRADVDFLADVGPILGSALRRSIRGERTCTAAPASVAGVLVLDRQLQVVKWTAAARARIDHLPGAEVYARFGIFPAMVYPVATLVRSGNSSVARALERGSDGSWVMIEAAPFEGPAGGEIVVSFRDATAGETFGRLCRTYGLSRRERDVLSAVCAGLDTNAVAAELWLSPYTVQDHLKSIFEKVGVHSRRELLATFSTAGVTSMRSGGPAEKGRGPRSGPPRSCG